MSRTRRLTLLLLVVLAAGEATARRGWSQEPPLSRRRHAWGRFEPGAWKRVRVLTEAFDASGRRVSTSTRETTTTLMDVDERSYTLQIDVVVDVAGRRFANPPHVVHKGFYGQNPGQAVRIEPQGDQRIDINGRKYRCQVQQVTLAGEDAARQVSTFFTSERQWPFVLRRESRRVAATGKPPAQQTEVEVTALGMPHRVLAEVKDVAYVKTVQRRGEQHHVTLEIQCRDVPGAVVAHSAKQCGADGQVVRRSTLELLDYGQAPPRAAPRPAGLRGLLRRHRGR